MVITRRWAIFAACFLALAGLGAYRLGKHNSEQANWHTATVDLASVGADPRGPFRVLSFQVDGWTYGIENSVMWTDRQGSVHDSGWPACLEPRHPGFSNRNHEKVRFGFAEVSVDADGFGWRPVVMVDCRLGGLLTGP